MVLFGTEPAVLFRNETDCRRFRRNVKEGGKKCPEQQLKLQFNKERGRRRGTGWTAEEREKREGSRSIQSRKMGWRRGRGSGSAKYPVSRL